ncbi:hypothetical protein HK104_003020 [Borealophlyctis nickersoniae]|nr:hypothetical protein HK104_003020 [Borealophlyctis nickersoniae]
MFVLRGKEFGEMPTFMPLKLVEESGGPIKEPTPDLSSLYIEGREPSVFRSAKDFHDAFKSGKTTPTAVAEAVIEAIENSNTARTPKLLAVIKHQNEEILQQAKESTLRYKEGKYLSPLDGVPVAIKDEIDALPYETDAHLVTLLRGAGGVIIGKTNMHEFGVDVTNCNAATGTPRNPYNVDHFTGGSSGGSGCAVAAGLCPLAIGADAGGSIRIPAAYNGVFGLKPTHGRISEHGSFSLAPTVTVNGPIAATAYDLALGYAIMAGRDEKDQNTLYQPPVRITSFGLTDTLEGIRIGIYEPYFNHADAEVVSSCEGFVEKLKSVGAEIVDIVLPDLELLRVAHLITVGSEFLQSTAPLPRKEFAYATRMMFGVLEKTLTTSDYLSAARVRTKGMKMMEKIFEEVDLIVTPTTAVTAPKIPESALTHGVSDYTTSGKAMRFIYLANLLGLPAATVPVGYSETTGVPVGMQFQAKWWNEDLLLRMAHVSEGLLDSDRRRPAVHTVQKEDIFKDGFECLKTMSESEFDLILLDIEMPVSSASQLPSVRGFRRRLFSLVTLFLLCSAPTLAIAGVPALKRLAKRQTSHSQPPEPHVKVLMKPIFEESATEELNVLVPLLQTFYEQTGIWVDVDIPSSAADPRAYLEIIKPFVHNGNGNYDLVALDSEWLQEWPETFFNLFYFGRDASKPAVGEQIRARVSAQSQSTAVDDGNQGHLSKFRIEDYGVLYTRTDLLQLYNVTQPQRWEDIPTACSIILAGERAKGNSNMHCFIAGFADQAVVQNSIEWLMTQSGATLFQYPQQITFNTPAGVATFDHMSDWESLNSWLRGEAIFYQGRMSANMQIRTRLQPKVNRTNLYNSLPVNPPGHPASLLGGYHLAMTKAGHYPNDTEVALALLYLTSETVQTARSRAHGIPPTIESLYKDPNVCAAIPCDFIDNRLQAINIPAAAASPRWITATRALREYFIAILNQTMSAQDGLNQGALRVQEIFREPLPGESAGLAAHLLAISVLAPIVVIGLGITAFVYERRRRRMDRASSRGVTNRTLGTRGARGVWRRSRNDQLAVAIPLHPLNRPARRRGNPDLHSAAAKLPEIAPPVYGAAHDTTDRHSGGAWDGRSRHSSFTEDPIGRTYNIIHAYKPVMADELELKAGDRVVVRLAYDDGYAFGTLEGSEKGGVFPLACLVPVGMEIGLPSRLESGAGPELQEEFGPEKVDSLEMLLLSGRISEQTYLQLRREQEEDLRSQRQIAALRERLRDSSLEPEERRKLQKRLDELELGI